ncbi:hypothetical protein [Leptolyngbya sp. PCC 6406]|uniref:hypothetical protein n=1 Tax=Leptolyngbya sp. PCC 6406 TaxID=1173264 RepID=UPI0002D27E7B|nr:hypothetical protein [Leptolyngbya sp. PCC 6406]
MITTVSGEQEAANQRFENLLADARADRQRADRDGQGPGHRAFKEAEHRAFLETFPTLLAELARIWGRLAR